LPMVIATLAVSTRSATGMAAIVAIVLKLVKRVTVGLARHLTGTRMATEIVTLGASTRRATGTVAIAEISPAPAI
jgi:hypothetical protein